MPAVPAAAGLAARLGRLLLPCIAALGVTGSKSHPQQWAAEINIQRLSNAVQPLSKRPVKDPWVGAG